MAESPTHDDKPTGMSPVTDPAAAPTAPPTHKACLHPQLERCTDGRYCTSCRALIYAG